MLEPSDPATAPDPEPPTPEALRGRRVVLLASITATALTLLVVAYQTSLGMFRLALVGRVLITLWVCWGMYKGRAGARIAFLFLMIMSVFNYGLHVHQDPSMWVYVIAHVGLALGVLIPASVRAHFADA